MKTVYTIGTRLGSGIGLTARHGIAGLERAGMLHRIITPADLGERPSAGDVDFDLRASKILEQLDFDCFVGWNNMSRESLRVSNAKKAGSVVIRASTHPRNQQRIMRQEWAKLGVTEDVFPNAVVERCEAEFALADKVLIPTDYVRKTMVANGVPEHKLHKAPHGVDLEAFPSEEQPPIFQPCFVGSNWLRKGLRYLLEGWRGPLLIAGCNPPPELLRTAPNAKCLEYVPDVRDVLKASSCLCLPSLEEGQALVLLEAASMGRGIVATEESGAPEFLEDQKSYLRVPPADPAAINKALSYLQQDEQACREMGRAARKAVERFPWSRYGDGLAKAVEATHV